MSSPIVNPEIPYNGEIPGGLQPGKMCRIQGVTHPNSDRFNINLQTGPNSSPRDDTSLHLSVRLKQGYIARNSYKSGEWGDEEGSGTLPIGQAQSFEILILVEPHHYKVAVNGQHFCEFPYRISFNDVSYLLINGDVSITLISWEAATPPAVSEALSQASQYRSDQSQGPQQQVGPQGPYEAPPPGYNPPGPYGPPPAGYGYGPPPPPGAQPESGAETFWDQAQSVLAGAIRSGAAEKLLSGLLSTGGQQQAPQGQGYAPQNARYGIYPQLPQDENSQPRYNQNPPNRGPGPVESFLSGLLSGGSNNQQQSYQQPPPPSTVYQQQPQQSQGSDLSSLLVGLLSPSSTQQGQNQPQYRGGAPQPVPPPQQQIQQSQNTNTDDISDLLANLIAGKNSQQQQPQQIPPQPQQIPPQPQQIPPQPQQIPPQPQQIPPQQPQQQQIQNPVPSVPQDGQSQQQYGQYPIPPQQHQEQRGPIESLLSGLLSGGGNQPSHQGYQQQPHIPHVGGEGSVGGLGSMGGVLSNLAGQILHKPRDG